MADRVYCRMQLVAAIWLSLALWLFAAPTSVLANGIPQQPASPYASNINAVNAAGPPMVMWTFRQTECLSMNITEDMGTGLTISRFDNTACPSSGSFSNAVVGATSTSSTTLNALRTNTGIGSTAFSPVTTQAAGVFRSLSLALWLTPVQSLSSGSSYHTVEIADEAPGTSSTADAHNQLQFFFVPGAANAAKLQVDALVNGAGNAGTPLSSGSFGTCFASGFKFTVNNSASSDALVNLQSGVGDRFFLGFTLQSDASGTTLVYYAGQAGGALTNCTKTASDISISFFAFPLTSPFRFGSTRVNGRFGLPAIYQSVALYNRSLSATEMTKFFNAGLPNSVPALVTGGFAVTLNEDQANPRVTINAAGSFFDNDGNDVKAIRIKTLPPSPLGQLLNNGNPVAINDVILNTDNFTFITPKDAFSTNDPNCTQFASNVNAFTYASFSYEATDGLGDGSASCTASPLAASCLSPQNGTFRICMNETNDPPVVVPPAGDFSVFAERKNAQAFQVQCRDIDKTLSSFGLSKIRLLNQSQPQLGRVYIASNGLGDCSPSAGSYFNASIPATTDTLSVSPGQNVIATIVYCYESAASTSNQSLIGTDIIQYECEDNAGTKTRGTVNVKVFNALMAGCGISAAEVAAQKTCSSMMLEDTPINVTLKGNDSVAGHTLANRYFRIDTFPPEGQLFLPSNLSDPILSSSRDLKADANGDLLLTFIPNKDYFNAVCELNKDPITPVCATPSFLDGLNATITPAAGPLNFSFSLGYDPDGAGANPAVYGPAARYEVTVLGVNDNTTSFVGPLEIVLTETSKDYFIRDLAPTTNAPEPMYAYNDPDGDTMRVGFAISMDGTQAIARFKNFTNPLVDQSNTRLTWVEGSDCLENGRIGCSFVGKAYKSDLQRLFKAMSVVTTRTKGNQTLTILIFDPAPNADSFLSLTFDKTMPYNASIASVLQFHGAGSEGSGADSGLTVALWAGIGAGFLFIFLACLACWSCLIGRAKRGEEAAMWMVRNVLCTDLERQANPDLRTAAAGGRKSLEAAIHAEHQRLARVVCCALFMRRVCPCLVKFDATNINVPDEETLIHEAIKEEKDKLAKKHVPKEAPPAVAQPPIQLAPDEEAVVAEDALADDSIFDWERHVDEKTKKVFYYNVKTHESRWTPPTVKVHERRKSVERASVKNPLYSPHPPTDPKPGSTAEVIDADTERVKKD